MIPDQSGYMFKVRRLEPSYEYLQRRVERLEGALKGALDLMWHPDRVTITEAWERRVKLFCKETGRGEMPAHGDEPAREEWQDAFHTWFNDRLRKAYAVLEDI